MKDDHRDKDIQEYTTEYIDEEKFIEGYKGILQFNSEKWGSIIETKMEKRGKQEIELKSLMR